MSAGNPCGEDEVNWDTGDHEVIGSICVFEDQITINFSGEGMVAFPYDEGQPAFDVVLGVQGQPFRGLLDEIRGALPSGVRVNIPSAQDIIPEEIKDDRITLDVTASRMEFEVDDPVSGDFGSFPSLSDLNPLDSAEDIALNFSYNSSYTNSVNFRRVSIPTTFIQDSRFNDLMPDSVTVEATVSPAGELDSLLNELDVFSFNRTMTMNIPADAFIERVEADFSCESQHSDIWSAASALQSDGEEFIQRVNNLNLPSISNRSTPQEALQDIRNDIEEFDGEDVVRSIFNRDESVLNEISTGQVTNFQSPKEARERLEELRNKVGDAVQELQSVSQEFDIGNLQRAGDIVDRARSNLSDTCLGQFNDQFGDLNPSRVESAAEKLESLREQIKNLQFLVDSSPPSGWEPGQGTGNTGSEIFDDIRDRGEEAAEVVREQLEQIPQEIFDRIDELRDRVEQIQNTQFIDRDPEELREARNQAQSLLEDIQELERGRPGRGEAIGEVESLIGDLSRIKAAEQSAIPCGSRFPDAEELVSDFEEEVSNISTDIDEDTLESLTELNETAASAVDQVESDQCSEQFARRLRQANRQIDIKVDPIRVAEDLVNQSRQRREQLLAQLGISGGLPDPNTAFGSDIESSLPDAGEQVEEVTPDVDT